MTGIIRKQFLIQQKLPDLETSVENIVKELSEVDLVFTFELTGRFHVTEKIKSIQTYLEHIEVPEGKDVADKDQLFENVLRPQLMTEVVKQLDDQILSIARKINHKTLNKVKAAFYPVEEALDKAEILSFLDDYIPRLFSVKPKSEIAQ